MLLMLLGEPNRVWPLLGQIQDPQLRTCLIHYLAPAGVDPGPLLERLRTEKRKQTPRCESPAAEPGRIQDQSAADPAPARGTGSPAADDVRDRSPPRRPLRLRMAPAATWAGRQDRRSGKRTEKSRPTTQPRLVRHVARTYDGHHPRPRRVHDGVAGGRGGTGKERAAASRDDTPKLCHCDQGSTLGQFRQFWKDFRVKKPKATAGLDCPADRIDFFMAMAYCNWLSEVEGIPKDQLCTSTEAMASFAHVLTSDENWLSSSRRSRMGICVPSWHEHCEA